MLSKRIRWLLFLALTSANAAGQSAEEGFVSLFDGKSLAGWVTRGGRHDGNAEWSVEEGCIVGRPNGHGEGGLLYTERPYTSFVLRLEVKMDFPFDSGLFVRMAPDARGAQITLDHHPDGEIGAVYSDEFLAHCETGKEFFRRDDWNEVEVRCTGFDMHLVCTLNGTTITDHEMQGGGGYAPSGLIGLQVHGGGSDRGVVHFRNVRVRELPVFGEGLFEPADPARPGLLAPTKEAAQAGWRSLFDGESLAGWKVSVAEGNCAPRDGVLAFLARAPRGTGGELQTEEDFRDFRLRLDFKLARMANSGVFLRAARDGPNPAFSGCEIQILDDFDWERVSGTTLKPWQFTGSLYGSVPPRDRSALKPLGEWNTYEILYQGSRLAVALNGRTLYDVDTFALQPESGEPFARRAQTGFIGLQHHGSEHVEAATTVEFRNLFVEPLAP